VSAGARSLLARASPLAEPAVQRRTLGSLPVLGFDDALVARGLPPLHASALEILQINVGKRCNQTCRHCHVDAGPDRPEEMSAETMAEAIALLDRAPGIHTVDITGGAPELHPGFRGLVEAARARGKRVIDRCNRTILTTGPYRDLAAFLGAHQVEVVASLPHVREGQTDRQRGDGVFVKSIDGMRALNAAGYGRGDPARRLVLVSNPVGAFLPAAQASLEREWKRELAARHGVGFDALLCLTNMPIGRFLEWLETSGNLVSYVDALARGLNPAAVPAVMCRNQVSVAWDGTVYDCDFNQMLELPPRDGRLHVRDLDPAAWSARAIATAAHCFGCTAGAGSSCGGALAS
jgi:radical SAM/Cys-rich protein